MYLEDVTRADKVWFRHMVHFRGRFRACPTHKNDPRYTVVSAQKEPNLCLSEYNEANYKKITL